MRAMKRYNIINNAMGWLAFLVAAVTYLLTVEPTASFWDCPEFIIQGFKFEVGHPPGNPIFMLTARFFITLFGGSAQYAALAVNCMSALLSAGTILLLFWTVTHLVKKLMVSDAATEVSPLKTLVIMGAGLCGALAYTWSDTFWFSAVEGEVYAFSSFCTALVFWLILKWENRAGQPHADRYLVLIAYVIGVSIAVHLLNLLCIPAIVLVYYYRTHREANVKGSLAALGVSVLIVFFILYGLVPGFINVAQAFELLFVNTLHCPFNTGVLVYTVLVAATFVWTLVQLYRQRSSVRIKTGFLLSIVLSGMPFVGEGALIPCILIVGLAVWLFGFCKKVPVRVFNMITLSIMVIFIGYSSYALLLIRSSADTPMNQNAPDNVFDLASYLNRKQYGERPLFYGQTIAEEPEIVTAGYDASGEPVEVIPVDYNGYPQTKPVRGIVYDQGSPVDNGGDDYVKAVKTDPSEPDRYVRENHHVDYAYSGDIKTLLPRMYSTDPKHIRNYKSWTEYENPDFAALPADLRQRWAQAGYAPKEEILPLLTHLRTVDQGTLQDGPYITQAWIPGWGTNMKFFLNYQLNHMYWRYFMWNFAGRQNDLAGNGEPHLGNWISGISVIDNARLGDQSALPDEFGKGNAGHNVFYMLPLLLGILGILWQALCTRHADPRRGIEQFWVTFFLFFMTGIAIVLYLNQTPCQPRERDYAFAGSFYAFAIWIGMGVPAINWLLRLLFAKLRSGSDKSDKSDEKGAHGLPPCGAGLKWTAAGIAAAIGLLVPLQMVSQTWDDHDRSGRYTARDFGMNYLNSLDKNAIIFTYGDNDTFPLWYAQEVEGVRTDVKVSNLSYLETDWYANQMRQQTYEAAPVPMYARPQDYAYNQLWMQIITDPSDSLSARPRDAAKALPEFYSGTSESVKRLRGRYQLTDEEARHILADASLYARLDSAATFRAFGRYPETADAAHGGAYMDLNFDKLPRQSGTGGILALDIIANSAAGGWKRPVYFATTVPTEFYRAWEPNMYYTGMARQITPFANAATSPLVDKAYANIMERWRWGGLKEADKLYLDETVRRMVSSTRLAILGIVDDLLADSDAPASQWAKDYARKTGAPVPATRADMARALLARMDRELPVRQAPYESMLDLQLAETYARLWTLTGNAADLKEAQKLLDGCVARYGQLVRYASTLTPGWRASLGTDRQALAYMAIAVGMQNYLDLRQNMLRAKAPQEELDVLRRTFGMNAGYESYHYFYLLNLSNEQIDRLFEGDYESRTPLLVDALRQLHAKYAVNPQTRTEQAARKAGVTVKQWQTVAHSR